MASSVGRLIQVRLNATTHGNGTTLEDAVIHVSFNVDHNVNADIRLSHYSYAFDSGSHNTAYIRVSVYQMNEDNALENDFGGFSLLLPTTTAVQEHTQVDMPIGNFHMSTNLTFQIERVARNGAALSQNLDDLCLWFVVHE